MATIAKENGGGGDFTPAPEGNHIARCIRVVDLGTQKGSVAFPDPKHQLMIAWELCEEKSEYEGVMTPIVVSKTFTLSLHKKAGLRATLESWRGKPFTSDELAGFDVANVNGHPCMINIMHAKSSDGTKTYANITAVTKVPKSMAQAVPPPFHDVIHYQIEDRSGGAFSKLPNWVREKIMKAPEFSDSGDNGADHDKPPPHDDDDIPF